MNSSLRGAALAVGIGLAVAGAAYAQGTDLLPPNAKPGECYARVWVPAQYETMQEKVLVREASERIEVIPAKYDWATEKVLVTEGYEKYEIIGDFGPGSTVTIPSEGSSGSSGFTWTRTSSPKFESATEKVMTAPATTKLVARPASYDLVSEKILDRPAHTIWKEGANPLQPVSNATGEIMCLVQVPDSYKTVTKRVVKTPARLETVEVPASYTNVTKKMVQPTIRKVSVAPVYKTVRVKKLVNPAREKRVAIPAEYKTVTKRRLVKDGHMQWAAILCETNMEPGLISDLQRALKNAGHNPGPIDGVMGNGTMAALRSYQASKGLAQGGITMETLESLGVRKR